MPYVITGYKWATLQRQRRTPTESNDVAANTPDKLKQMQDIFYAEAKKYDVFVVYNSTLTRWNSPKLEPQGWNCSTGFNYGRADQRP